MVCECDYKNVPQSESVPALTSFPSSNELELDTEVVVIGNGPAGISLSAFLSGWLPFYNKKQQHPDEVINVHLLEARGKSLIDQDLSWFQDECSERINPGVGAFAAFYDTLVRPPVDEQHQFLDSGCHTSCLEWQHLKHRAVPHIVLGDGEIGGSWNCYDDDMVTVSMAHWMDLPFYPLAAWMGGKPLINRLPAAVIRQYFYAYTKHLQIDSNFRPFSKVTSVMNFCYDPTGERYWQVSGLSRGLPFRLRCRKIVLACGRSHPKTLEVMGELDTTDSRVVYDVASMKRVLSALSEESSAEGEASISPMWSSLGEKKNGRKQVVVVGDGISAADAVLHCLANAIPVLHLIRRNEKQIRNLMIARLSAMIYPEYAKVFRLMSKRETHPDYRCCTSSQIVSLDNHLQVVAIQTPQEIINEPFECVVACVGRQSQLEMLSGKFEFLANYQSSEDSTLFAIGSLAGDHFVRYLIGGALQVAQTLIKQDQEMMHQRKAERSLLCHPWLRTFREIQENACLDEKNMLGVKNISPNKRSCKKYQLKENPKKITTTNKCCLMNTLYINLLRPNPPLRTSCGLQSEK